MSDNFDDVEVFLDEWWEGRDLDKIDRPETIEEGDTILEPTKGKNSIDLRQHCEFFNEQLTAAIKNGKFTACTNGDRNQFRSRLIRLIAANSTALETPQIIFAGGGYGSGKTTTLSYEAKMGRLPMNAGHMVGVDYFKLYIPEFNLLQEVADGRASLTVQDECKMLSENLFQVLIQNKRSFVWDSSLSNQADSTRRISEAVQKGYKVSLFAVVAPLQIAIRQAMGRAKDTKRFPHPVFLPQSHSDFRRVFSSYVPLFDDIKVFANEGKMGNLPSLIAEKKDGKELAINNEQLFNQLLKVPV